MAQRRFTTQQQSVELHEFTIDGVGQLTGKPWSETFHCLAKAPASALDDLSASAGTNTAGDIVFNQVSVLRFFRGVLVPDDERRFDELMRDKDRAVSIDELGDVLFWLAEVYTDRPTVPSPSSAGTPTSDGDTSTAAASATAST